MRTIGPSSRGDFQLPVGRWLALVIIAGQIGLALVNGLAAEAGSPPSAPGAIQVAQVTAQSAWISWGAATGADGVTLAYDVHLRKRIEGVAQEWRPAKETTATSVQVTGLTPNTVYDVRVRAWVKSTAGAWGIRENAFRTLDAGEANRPPSLPGRIEIAEVTAKSARISWGPSEDPDGDRVVYLVSVRRRIEGKAQEWLAAEQTRATSFVADGLAPRTVYDVRVRAADGKTTSPWVVRENAFTTEALTRLTGFVERPGAATPPVSEPNFVLAWPVTAATLEVTDGLATPTWVPYAGEVETDGTFRRTILPAGRPLRFFRVR